MRNREAARRKAEELVSQMTLEEKASQLKYDAPATTLSYRPVLRRGPRIRFCVYSR